MQRIRVIDPVPDAGLVPSFAGQQLRGNMNFVFTPSSAGQQVSVITLPSLIEAIVRAVAHVIDRLLLFANFCGKLSSVIVCLFKSCKGSRLECCLEFVPVVKPPALLRTTVSALIEVKVKIVFLHSIFNVPENPMMSTACRLWAHPPACCLLLDACGLLLGAQFFKKKFGGSPSPKGMVNCVLVFAIRYVLDLLIPACSTIFAFIPLLGSWTTGLSCCHGRGPGPALRGRPINFRC